MADKMMRVAGRGTNGTAQPLNVDNNGRPNVNRPWNTEVIELFNSVLTTTDRVRVTDFNASAYPVVTLRVVNDTGVPVTIEFLDDTAITGRYILDGTGAFNNYPIPKSAQVYAITPADIPLLAYIYKIRLFVKASDTPNGTGAFKIYAVVKY